MSDPDALIRALLANDVDRVTSLLSSHPDLALERSPGGPSPLLAAAYSRNAVLVSAIRSRVECNACEAAALGDTESLTGLLDAHPEEVGSFSGDGWTPLHLAAFFGHVAAAALLLKRGANVLATARSAEANHPLHAAIAGAGSSAIILLLLDAGADVNATAAGGVRPLHLAASRGDRGTVEMLLARGADPRVRMGDGRTAAMVASERGFAELADFLSRRAGDAGGA